MRFHPGFFGNSDVSVDLTNGMVSKVGQKVDTKIPETFDKLNGLVTAASAVAITASGPVPKPTKCKPTAFLYRITEQGDLGKATEIPVYRAD